MQNQESSRVYYGGFFVRLAAAWADAFFVACALITLRMPVWLMADSGNPLYQPILFQFTLWDIFLYLLGSAYYVFLTYMTGATLGKRMFSLRVVSADGRRLSLWDVLYRETIGKYLSGAFLSIGYIMAGIDREKRAFHDILCDTRVIYSFGREPLGENGQQEQHRPDPAQVTGAYRNVEDYYKKNSERYEAADYGYKKPESPEAELSDIGEINQPDRETEETPENEKN